MKTALALLLKLAVTLGIFAAIFLEFGGGYVPVATARLGEPGAFAASNPAYPGIVGRLRARLAGRPLPPARLPVSLRGLRGGHRPDGLRTRRGRDAAAVQAAPPLHRPG